MGDGEATDCVARRRARKSVDQYTNIYRWLQVLLGGVLLMGLSLAVASCSSHQPIYPPDDSLRKGAPLRVPQEFQDGTASAEQAKAWARVILMGSGTLVTEERELTPGGRRALFISDTSNAGTAGGNLYVVFDQTANGMRYLGDIEFGSCRAVGPAASGRPRLVTYWHMSASEGGLDLWLLTDEGFRAIKSVTIHPGDSGTEEGNRIYEAFFGSKPVTEPLIETTFGVNPVGRPN